MDSTVTPFRPRPPAPPAPDAPRPAPAGRSAAPVVSLPLLLRAVPRSLQPATVAREMLDAETSAAAEAVLRCAQDRILRLASRRGLDVPACIRLGHDFQEAVRRAAAAENAKRRAARAAWERELSTPEGWHRLLGGPDSDLG